MNANPTLVLFVSGNEEHAKCLEAACRECFPGLLFLSARDGLEGLALAASDDPDVILLGGDIPDMNAFALCRRLKGQDTVRTIPVLFLAVGDGDKAERLMAVEAGCDGFVQMPPDRAMLTVQLRTMTSLRTANRVEHMEVGQLSALVDKRSAKLRRELTERIRAERTLRESEERYRALVERQRDAVCRWTPDTTLTFANRSYMEHFGVAAPEIGRRKWIDYVPEESRAAVTAFYGEYLAEPGGRHYEYEHEVACADGSVRVFHWIDTPVLDGEGRCAEVQSIGRDVTEQRKAEEARRESETRFQYLLESAPDAIFVQTGGCFAYANRAALRLFGAADAQELLEQPVLDRFHPDDREKVAERIRHLNDERNAVPRMVETCLRLDGTPVTVEASAVPIVFEGQHGALVFLQDITERLASGEALRESEARFRDLFMRHAAVKLLIDPETGEIVDANEAAVEFYGYPHPLLTAMKIQQINTLPDEEVRREMARARALNKVYFEFRHCLADGSVRDVDVYSSKVAVAGRDLLYSVIIDVTERRKAEAALRESEQQYRVLANSGPMLVWSTDEYGQCTFCNEPFLRFTGLPLEEVTGTGWSGAVHPDDLGRCMEAYAEFFARREPFSIEFRLRHADGGYRWVRDHATPRYDTDCKFIGYIGQGMDINDRVNAETALRENEDRLKDITSSMADWIWEVDPTGVFTYSSEGCMRVLGYPVEGVLGRTPFDFMEPAKAGRVASVFGECVRMKAPVVDLENWYLSVDGQAVCLLSNGVPKLDQNGNLVSYRGVCKNITVQKSAERERELLRAAIEQSGDVFIITDAAGTIAYVNPAFEAVTGYSAAEAVGWTPRILKSGRHDEAFYRKLWGQIKGGGTWQGRFTNRRKDGSLYHEEATISPIFDIGGRITNFVASKHDITAELKLEEQYTHAQKMESFGRLAGGVAHDFNNMLGVILGYTEMAMMQVDPASPIQDDLREIQSATERSSNLTRQLLAFARRQPASPRLLNLNDNVGEMLKMLRRLIGETITLEWRPELDLWGVMVDPSQIDQIMANLCVNARDAMAGRGRITIGTENMVVDNGYAAAHPGSKPGDYVVLNIADDGCGMDEETLSKIFEPFFTTKSKGKGTGLGLPMVYGIVHQNAGFISVVSEPGMGTAFSIYFPRHMAVLENDDLGAMQDLPMGNGEVVMVVEDEPAILRMTRDMLEQLGYRVLPAGNAEEALALCKDHPGTADLLLTDVVLPHMNGQELAKRLQTACPSMKCLFMSGYTADIIASHGVVEEDVLFIQKPFPATALAGAVRSALDA